MAAVLVQALVTGSLLYNLSSTSSGLFMRFSAVNFPILFFCLNSMSEVTASFMGRPIISRQKRLAFARPAAHALACTVTDIPYVFVLYSLFHIVFYFMVWFQIDGSKFFTSWFIYVLTVLCFSSFYRMLGAWCRHFGLASQLSGWFTMVWMVYTGRPLTIETERWAN